MAAGDVIVISENAGGRKGVYFDGADDYTLVDAHAVERVAAGDTTGTYTAWIYLDEGTPSTENCILSAGDNSSTDEGLRLLVDTAGRLYVLLRHGGASQFSVRETTGSMVSKVWTHVAVVQNGTQPELYVNGSKVATTNATATDLTMWYDGLTLCDKFAIGVMETNSTHVNDFKGAIGQVKYWASALTPEQIKTEYTETIIPTAYGSYGTPTLNITMDQDGITDAGTGADNGTLTGHAFYGGWVSDWSYHLQFDGHLTGHAAEDVETFIDGSKYVTVIRRGE